jgi:hypothetical protein
LPVYLKERKVKSICISLICMIVGAVAFAVVVGCESEKKVKSNDPQVEAKDSPTENADAEENYKPKDGYVPDAETAIAVAVAIWNPIYGKKQIEKEKPFKASLSNGVWRVRGSLPEGWVGGVAIAEISKDDCKVLRVIHEK